MRPHRRWRDDEQLRVDCDADRSLAGALGLMVSHSIRRTRRNGWRFAIGVSLLGLVIIASASHANAASDSAATPIVAQAF